jgi:predicted nucleic acid-binding protein
MNADVFLDTNILVYAFDQTAPSKRDIVRTLIRGESDWVISWQVVQEFCSVALHKFASPLRDDDLRDTLDFILLPHCRVMPTADLYRQAVAIHSQTRYRFYDSLIVASALVSGVRMLYSEDLQHGREIGGLRIENPFLAGR